MTQILPKRVHVLALEYIRQREIESQEPQPDHSKSGRIGVQLAIVRAKCSPWNYKEGD